MRRFVAIAFVLTLFQTGLPLAAAAAQENPAPYINGAEVRVGSKKWAEAEQFIKEEALVAFPESPELWYWLGVVYAQGTSRNTEEAAKAFAKANELASPEDTELKTEIETAVKAIWAPLVNSAAKAADAGDYAKAEAQLVQATQINPQGPEGWINLGTVYLKQDKNDEAAAAYKKAIELQPENETLTYNLGITYHEIARAAKKEGEAAKAGEHYKLAEATYKAYLAKHPEDASIINNLAALYQEQGDEAKMRETLGQVAEAETATAQDLYNAGLAALKGKEYEKAADSFRKAIAAADPADPASGEVLRFSRENLGLALTQLKQYDEAIQVLQELLATNPDAATAATAHEYLGFAYRESGRREEAAAAFAKAEELKKAGAAGAEPQPEAEAEGTSTPE